APAGAAPHNAAARAATAMAVPLDAMNSSIPPFWCSRDLHVAVARRAAAACLFCAPLNLDGRSGLTAPYGTPELGGRVHTEPRSDACHNDGKRSRHCAVAARCCFGLIPRPRLNAALSANALL